MRAVLWWGADDHSYSPKIPIHGGATAIHYSYDDHNCTGARSCRAGRLGEAPRSSKTELSSTRRRG